MGIQQTEGHLRVALQPAPNCCRDRLPGLAAQTRLVIQFNDDTAHGPHFVVAGGNVHADAEVFVQALLQALQVLEVLEVFQAFKQALFFLSGEQEDAPGRLRVIDQVFAAAVAGTRRARLAQRRWCCHGASIARQRPEKNFPVRIKNFTNR